ncbi:MAG: hypothetical protein K2O18_00780 [Oscillospiraceae bacterium]|nr:hypothetical protein [Oscillospiraceae bacterium]
MQKIWILLLALCLVTGCANTKENADSKTSGTPETLGTYIFLSEAYQDFISGMGWDAFAKKC